MPLLLLSQGCSQLPLILLRSRLTGPWPCTDLPLSPPNVHLPWALPLCIVHLPCTRMPLVVPLGLFLPMLELCLHLLYLLQRVLLRWLPLPGTHHLCRNSLLLLLVLLLMRSLQLKLLLGLHDILNALLWSSRHWSAALRHTDRQLLLLLLSKTCLPLRSLPLSLQHTQALLLLL